MFHCRSMLLGIELSQILFASHSAWEGTYDLDNNAFSLLCLFNDQLHHFKLRTFARNLICVYSKKHMNDDPEHSEEKRKANIRSLKEMALLLRYPNYLFSLLLDQKLGCDKIIFETWFGIYLSLLIFVIYNVVAPSRIRLFGLSINSAYSYIFCHHFFLFPFSCNRSTIRG